jgi:hypothetical protein
VNRPSFTSRIPDEHPHKSEIEAQAQRLMAELGTGWSLSITIPFDRRCLELCLVRRLGEGARSRNRNWIAAPPQQDPVTVGRWLRAAADEMREESKTRFGMVPMDRLDREAQGALLDLVVQFGGRMNPEDCWITFPEDRTWRAFEDRVLADLGLRLVASLR